MLNKKWCSVSILIFLKEKIQELVDEGKYPSVNSFINMAIREKLDREHHLMSLEPRQEKEEVEA